VEIRALNIRLPSAKDNVKKFQLLKEIIMSDPEEFSTEKHRDSEHAERVSGAFASLEEKLTDRSAEEKQRVAVIREAALKRDRDEVEKHLAATKHESNWLYEELIKHPGISTILRELSIMGF
jgi:hypothetical protein